MFERIVAAIKEMYQHMQDKKAFRSLVFSAAADGKLSVQDLDELSRKMQEYRVTYDDITAYRADVYESALRSSELNGTVTKEAERELNKIQTFLRIPDGEIAGSKRELAKLRLLNEIQVGNMPTVEVKNLVLQKGETPHWSEPASLLEERVVSRHYEGRSQGVSIRVMKGVSYRVGASRGNLVADKQIMPVSTGSLVVTNKRVIFNGNAKSFALRLEKILNVQPFADGLQLSDDKGHTRLMKYASNWNSEVVASILSHAINNCVND